MALYARFPISPVKGCFVGDLDDSDTMRQLGSLTAAAISLLFVVGSECDHKLAIRDFKNDSRGRPVCIAVAGGFSLQRLGGVRRMVFKLDDIARPERVWRYDWRGVVGCRPLELCQAEPAFVARSVRRPSNNGETTRYQAHILPPRPIETLSAPKPRTARPFLSSCLGEHLDRRSRDWSCSSLRSAARRSTCF